MNNFNLKRLLSSALVLLLSASFVLSSCNSEGGTVSEESTNDTTAESTDISQKIDYSKIYRPTKTDFEVGVIYTFDPKDITFDLSDKNAEAIRFNDLDASVQSEIGKLSIGNTDYVLKLAHNTPITGLIFEEGYTYSIDISYYAESTVSAKLVAKNAQNGGLVIGSEDILFDSEKNKASCHYTVRSGDGELVFLSDSEKIEGVYVSEIAVELAANGPTIAQLTSENGYDWPLDKLMIGEGELMAVENCTSAVYNAITSNGFAADAPVLYTTGGNLASFDRSPLFVPGYKYTFTVEYYAESTGGYIIALDSTSGNHAYAGPNAFTQGYHKSSYSATVGENGEYALTFFNIPNLYILSFNVKLEIPDESNDGIFSPPEKFYEPTLEDLDKGYTFKFTKGRTPALSGGEYINVSALPDSEEYDYLRSILTEENGFSDYAYHIDRKSLVFDALSGYLEPDVSVALTMRIYCELPQDQIGMLCHGVSSALSGSGDSKDANFKVKAVEGLKNVYDLKVTVTPGPNTHTYITYYCTEEDYYIISLKVKMEGIAPDYSATMTTDHPEYAFVSNDNAPAESASSVLVTELVANMSGSAFTTPLSSSDSPLTDASNVGIIYEEFDDILYPVPANSEFDVIINVGDFGISPSNSPERNSKAFASLVRLLSKTKGLKKVYFPEGEYKFSSTLNISKVNDVYFCSERFDKYFDILITEWTGGIVIEDCENIHFNNYTLDYQTPSAVTGKIVSTDTASNKIVIEISEGFDLTKKEYQGGKKIVKCGSYIEYIYDELSGSLIPNKDGNLIHSTDILDASYDADSNRLTLTFSSIKDAPEGTTVNVAFTMYDFFGVVMNRCTNLYFDQVKLYHTLGMSIGGTLCKDVYINGLCISPKPNTNRLMTATADGFHPSLFRGEIIVTNSLFEQSHDDSFNVKNAYQDAVSIQPTRVFYNPSSNIYVEAGDVIEIYRSSDFEFMGEYTVKEVDEKKNCYIIEGYIEEKYSSNHSYRICNVSKGASVKISNTLIGNKRNRGMLLQTRNIEISNCTFMNIVHGSINVLSVHDSFMEGHMPGNVVIKNCKFINNNWPDVYVYTWGSGGQDSVSRGVIKNITVENNFFAGQSGIAVSFWGVGESQIKNNLFAFLNYPNAISIAHSKDVTVADNLLVDTDEKTVCALDYNNISAIKLSNTECVVAEVQDVIYGEQKIR